MIQSISVLHFSPTGSTRRIALLAAECVGGKAREVDLAVRNTVGGVYTGDDVVIVAVPVFMGRVPRPAVEALARVSGGQARAIAMVVYGNRHYGDALLELCDLLRKQEFRVAAAGAFIAQHSIAGAVAAGRPDNDDIADIRDFASRTRDKIVAGAPLAPPSVPGNHPYIELPSAKRPIDVSDACANCGLCAEKCPVSAIPEGYPQQTDLDKCFSCMRCIRICPQKARTIQGSDKMADYLISSYLNPRRVNELFL